MLATTIIAANLPAAWPDTQQSGPGEGDFAALLPPEAATTLEAPAFPSVSDTPGNIPSFPALPVAANMPAPAEADAAEASATPASEPQVAGAAGPQADAPPSPTSNVGMIQIAASHDASGVSASQTVGAPDIDAPDIGTIPNGVQPAPSTHASAILAFPASPPPANAPSAASSMIPPRQSADEPPEGASSPPIRPREMARRAEMPAAGWAGPPAAGAVPAPAAIPARGAPPKTTETASDDSSADAAQFMEEGAATPPPPPEAPRALGAAADERRAPTQVATAPAPADEAPAIAPPPSAAAPQANIPAAQGPTPQASSPQTISPQPAHAAHPAPPVPVADASRHIAERLLATTPVGPDGARELRVRLLPGALGGVEVRLAAETSGRVELSLLTDTSAARDHLMRDEAQLKQLLETLQPGIAVRIDARADRDPGLYWGAASQQQARQETPGERRRQAFRASQQLTDEPSPAASPAGRLDRRI